MNNWRVYKDGNCYRFYSKNTDINHPGIREITIYIFDIPSNRHTETYAKTSNLKTYQNILNEGRQYASEKYKGLSTSQQHLYYFDNTHSGFGRMNDSVRKKFFSEPSIMNSFLESALSHDEPFDEDDAHGCASNIEESLRVLEKADKHVAEIIDYMNETIAPRSSFRPK